MHGYGDGSFEVSHYVEVGNIPRSIAAWDFDLDGYPDVAVVNQGDKTVNILHGGLEGPTAITQTLSTIATDPAPMFVIFVDWNLDGYADLAVVKSSFDVIFSNDKTGGFYPVMEVPGGWHAHHIVAADLNNNFWPDLITSDSDDGSVTIYFIPPQTP